MGFLQLEDTIIIDNSPHSYIFQPENAVPIGTFVGDQTDKELLDMIPQVWHRVRTPELPSDFGSRSRGRAGFIWC